MTKRYHIKYTLTCLMLTFAIVRYCKEYQCSKYIYYNEKLADNPNYYLSCDAGDIYILNEDDISQLPIFENAIIAVDCREKKDPNICVISSYKIKDPQSITEILLILKNYEQNNPSKWHRSLISMENEWKMHNILYENNYWIGSTKDLDLNNADEFLISKKNLETILKLNKTSE